MAAASSAGRRYLQRFMPTMIVYVIALLGAQYVIHTQHPTGMLLYALAVLPALPIIAVIAIIGLYVIEERDEYMRQKAVTGMLVALGAMLSIATAYGFLEMSDVVPRVDSYWAFVLWCAAWAVWQGVSGLRERFSGAAA